MPGPWPRVYVVRFAEGGERAHAGEGVGLFLADVGGVRQGAAWVPQRVELRTEEEGRALAPVDCPGLALALPLIKDEALERVRRHLVPDVELLPLDCPQVPLTAINVLETVDAVDEQRSKIDCLRSGKVGLVLRLAVHHDRLPENGLFRLPRDVDRKVYCTGNVVAVLRGLSGLDLIEVDPDGD